MWDKSSQPPSPFGECTICKRHDCGEYTDKDGSKQQAWLHFPLEMDRGGRLHIGWQCIKGMSEDMGITKEIMERKVFLTPTPEQIHDYIMQGLNNQKPDQTEPDTPDFASMNRDELKAYLTEKGVKFAPQTGDEKLRELAAQHV